jgi:putative DNA primase/helicase
MSPTRAGPVNTRMHEVIDIVTNDSRKIKGSREAWHARAPELADWTAARLVNRTDACGGYYHGGPVTRRVAVNRALLARHYRAEGVRDVIGLHSADAGNLGRWGALDIDLHGGDDPVRAEANRLAALHWYGVLVRQGFHPLLTGSNGKGGFHLRVLLAEAIDDAWIFRTSSRISTRF